MNLVALALSMVEPQEVHSLEDFDCLVEDLYSKLCTFSKFEQEIPSQQFVNKVVVKEVKLTVIVSAPAIDDMEALSKKRKRGKTTQHASKKVCGENHEGRDPFLKPGGDGVGEPEDSVAKSPSHQGGSEDRIGPGGREDRLGPGGREERLGPGGREERLGPGGEGGERMESRMDLLQQQVIEMERRLIYMLGEEGIAEQQQEQKAPEQRQEKEAPEQEQADEYMDYVLGN